MKGPAASSQVKVPAVIVSVKEQLHHQQAVVGMVGGDRKLRRVSAGWVTDQAAVGGCWGMRWRQATISQKFSI